MTTKIKYIYLLLGLAFFLGSCHKGIKFSEIQKIPEEGWNAGHVLEFHVPVNDTTHAFDILFYMRNSYKYPYRNLWLFVETTAPAGHTRRDTLEFYLADERGQWLGKGLGDINSMLLQYQNNILFPVTGVYTITVEQAMRTENLPYITDFGVQIKKQD